MSTHFSATHFLKPPSAKFLRTRCSSFSSHACHQTTIGCFFSTSFFTTWCNFTRANSGRIHVSICRRIYFEFTLRCSFTFCTKFCHYLQPFLAIFGLPDFTNPPLFLFTLALFFFSSESFLVIQFFFSSESFLVIQFFFSSESFLVIQSVIIFYPS